MIPLGPGQVGVENEAELRSACGDSTINYIRLVNNIALLNAITILASKASLVIDGEYPQDSGVFHVFTDIESTDYNRTIGIRGTSSITLTFRNMTINGHNYYGVPYIIESIPILFIDTSNVSVIYENVTYTGPQLTHNRYGFTRYQDCDITIMQNGGTQSQEVGEVCRVEFGGRTTIYHTSDVDDRAVFWFNNSAGTSSLTVLPGAQVDINSVYSYFMYNMEGLISAPVTYTVQQGASFRLQASRGISFNQSHPVSSFRVGDGASFHYIQTGSNDPSASLYMSGALEAGPGSRFYMQAQNGTQPLIRFTSGANRRLTIDNPLSFVLYSPNATALNALGQVSFGFDAGQLNTWSAATTPVESAGGFEDRPEFSWFKKDYLLPLEFSGTFTQSATTGASNLAEEDEPHPADADLHLHAARVISLGDWPVNVNPIVDDGRPITGTTEPYANLRVEYDAEGTAHTIGGAAGEDGSFTIATSQETPPTIPADTEVSIWSNIPFLIKRVIRTAIQTGELMILSAPEQIIFRPSPISVGPPILPRTDPEEPVIVWDDRADVSQWELLASITGPLTTQRGDTLEEVVFVQAGGGTPVVLSNEPHVVFTGGPSVETTNVFWPEEEGILVRVAGPIRSGVVYTTQLIWDLRSI